jgi:hypothetical protein
MLMHKEVHSGTYFLITFSNNKNHGVNPVFEGYIAYPKVILVENNKVIKLKSTSLLPGYNKKWWIF